MKHYLTKILMMTSIVAMVLGCSNLSTQEEQQPIIFEGIKEITATDSGSLLLTWEQVELVEIVGYEIYMQDLNIAASSLALTEGEEKADISQAGVTTVFLELPDEQSPITLGNVINISEGDLNSFEVKDLLPGKYAFQIRAVAEDGRTDDNRKVFLTTIDRAPTYAGIESAVIEGENVLVTWPVLETYLEGGVSYTVYEGNAFNKPVAISKETSISIPLRGRRPGLEISYGVRAVDPKGRADRNTKTIKITVPEEAGTFEGCIDAEPRGADRILVKIAWPEAEYEVFKVLRNGVQAFATRDRGVSEFMDVGLQEGETYEYSCTVEYKEIKRTGLGFPKAKTLSSNPPTFNGVRTVEILGPHSAKLTWGVTTGVPNSKFLIYANPGKVVNFGAEPIGEAEASALEYVVEGLGDDLQYAFGVRSVSIEQVRDFNEVSLWETTPNDEASPAPLTVGATEAVIKDGRIVIQAPWDHTKGGVAVRYLYIKEDGPAVADAANPLDGYVKVFTRQIKPEEMASRIYKKTEAEIEAEQEGLLSAEAFAVSSSDREENIFPTELYYARLVDNTDYHIVVIDEDPNGNLSKGNTPITINSGDTTKPVFQGVKDIMHGPEGSEETSLQATFIGINPEVIDKYGADEYLVYALEGGGDACAMDTPHQRFAVANFTPEVENTIIISGLKVFTYYNICVKAVDAAGNVSDTKINSQLISTLDITAPEFDGIQSLSYDRINAKMVVGWNTSPTEDVFQYKISVWKGAKQVIEDVTPMRVIYASADVSKTGYEFDLDQEDILSGVPVTYWVQVQACDNAGSIGAPAEQNCSEFQNDTARDQQLDDLKPPQNFPGIKTPSASDLDTEGEVDITWFAPLGGDWTDYRGFIVYALDMETNEILTDPAQKECLCSGDDCPDQITTCATAFELPAGKPYCQFKLHVRAFDNTDITKRNYTQLDKDDYSIIIRAPDKTAPSFNGALQDPILENGEVILSWTKGTDAQCPDEDSEEIVVKHEVYRKVLASGTAPVFNFAGATPDGELVAEIIPDPELATMEYVDTLNPSDQGKEYHYTICAVDMSGNRACDEAEKEVTIPDLVPPEILCFKHNKGQQGCDGAQLDAKNALPSDSATWHLSWTVTDNRTTDANNRDYDLCVAYSDDPEPSDDLTYSCFWGAPFYEDTTINPVDAQPKEGLKGRPNVDEWIHYKLIAWDDGSGGGSTYRNSTEKVISLRSNNFVEITDIRSNEAVSNSTTPLVILGNGFKEGATVTLGANVACIGADIVLSSQHIKCTVPTDLTVGAYNVTVTNLDGSFFTLDAALEICDPTVIGDCQNICNDSVSWTGTDFALGNGSIEDPFIICNETHLSNISKYGYKEFYELHANIELSPTFLPITSSDNQTFHGDFNGNGHALIGFTSTNASASVVGVFKRISARWDTTTDVYDLGILDVSIQASTYAGALAGCIGCWTSQQEYYSSRVKIRDIYVTGTVEGSGDVIGGVAGRSYSDTFGAVSNTTVSGDLYVGGIYGIGRRASADLTNYGNVTSDARGDCRVGGIAGEWGGSNIVASNISNYGDITCQADGTHRARYAGGLYGVMYSGGVDGAIVEGTINCEERCGGAYGYVSNIGSTNIDSKANITGTHVVGGIVGESYRAPISNSIYSGTLVNTSSYTGGIVAYVSGSNSSILTTFEGNEHKGSILSPNSDRTGGIVGSGNYIRIHKSKTTGYLNGRHNVGGIMGWCQRSYMKEVEFSGNIGRLATYKYDTSAPLDAGDPEMLDPTNPPQVLIDDAHVIIEDAGESSWNHVGGIMGRAHEYHHGCNIEPFKDQDGNPIEGSFGAKATGTVRGKSQVGGIAGRFRGKMELVEADVDVVADDDGAGLIGRITGWSDPERTRLKSVSAEGFVRSDTRAAGLVGYIEHRAVIEKCFATGQITSRTYGGGLIAHINERVTVSECFATGNVEGDRYIGGFIGLVNYGASRNVSITHAYATGDVSGNTDVGGFAGKLEDDTAEFIFSTGTVSNIDGNTRVHAMIGAGGNSVESGFYDQENAGVTGNADGTGVDTSDMYGADLWVTEGFAADEADNSIWIFNPNTIPKLKFSL